MIQVIINIIYSSSIITLVSISFSVIYLTSKFFHFAHTVIFTFCAYFSFLFIQILGWTFFTAVPSTIIATCLIGCMIEWLVYNPLRKKKSSSIVLPLASLSICVVLQNPFCVPLSNM